MAKKTSRKKFDVLEHVIFNENAYFYRDKGLTTNHIKALFDKQVKGASNELFFREYDKQILVDQSEVRFSTLIFKKKCIPTCIEKGNPYAQALTEVKVAYILLMRMRGYVVIVKKNAVLPAKFREHLAPISYRVLIDHFVDSKSVFKKISMQNLDVSHYAMRSKSLESNDLSCSASTFGFNNYYLTSFKVNNVKDSSSETITLALQSSRINKNGGKDKLEQLAKWSHDIIDQIECSANSSNKLVSSFAECVEDATADSCEVTNVLLLLNNLVNFVESEDIKVYYGTVGKRNITNLESIVQRYCSDVLPVCDNRIVRNKTKCFVELVKKEKGLVLKDGTLSRCILLYPNGSTKTAVDWLNENNAFVALFKDSELRYANGMFFRDSQLNTGIDSFLALFVSVDGLEKTTSEKGHGPGKRAKKFPLGSIFRAVEDKYVDEYTAFVCDDLGTEFADHIGIDEDRIALFVEKGGSTGFSASAFHVVVSQAQKNLGSFNFIGNQEESKKKKLARNYAYSKNDRDEGKTSISMIRSQNKDPEFVMDLWNKASRNVFLKKELFLVVNFISKSFLDGEFLKIKESKQCNDTNAKMILWLISSLAGSCKELNVDLHILCRP